jgi:hypothetical protein
MAHNYLTTSHQCRDSQCQHWGAPPPPPPPPPPPAPPTPPTHTHTRTHTHTHTHTHAHTHARTHAHKAKHGDNDGARGSWGASSTASNLYEVLESVKKLDNQLVLLRGITLLDTPSSLAQAHQSNGGAGGGSVAVAGKAATVVENKEPLLEQVCCARICVCVCVRVCVWGGGGASCLAPPVHISVVLNPG